MRDPKLKKGAPAKNKQTQKHNQPEQASENTKKSKKSKSQRQNDLADDTPKAFRRLMQFQATGQRTPSGLDTGKKQKKQPQQKKDNTQDSEGNNKKRKREDTKDEADNNKNKTKDTKSAQAMPQILPGEKLSEFAARVDRTLPLSAMKKSNAPGVGKMREDRQTRHEKHLRRLQQGWREEDTRIREREQAEREERETEMEDQLRLWKEWEAEAGAGKAKKKAAASAAGKKKKKGKNNRTADGGDDETGGHVSDDDDPDPWAKLKKRDRERKANPFDVVQAPPQLTKPREIFKVRGGAKVDVANVPAAVGSLRRREELAGERRTIVEEYRRLMAEKRG